MDKSNLNKVFIWSPIETIDKLHKQPNGNTVRHNGVATFTPSMIWHYSKNYNLKGRAPFSLILCTLTDDPISIDKYLDMVAKKLPKETIDNVFAVELSPMFLPTGDEFKEGEQ